MLKLNLLILSLLCILQTNIVAQDINVVHGVDSNEVSIGDYIHLTTSITYPTDKYTIVFPNINELYTAPFTIISQTKIDTSQTARSTSLQQTTTIACYDSGLYQLNKLFINGFNTNNDSALNINADSLLIKVNAVPINIHGDIKDIFSPKQTTNYWPTITMVTSVCLALLFIIYLIKKYVVKQKNKPVPIVDPYKKTMETLLHLQQKPITTQDQTKHFFSTLTDACKYYLQHRLHVSVLDKTTIQIKKTLQNTTATTGVAMPITTIFQLADLVKFAKQPTVAQQNKDALEQAIAIVQSLEKNYQQQLLQQTNTTNE